MCWSRSLYVLRYSSQELKDVNEPAASWPKNPNGPIYKDDQSKKGLWDHNVAAQKRADSMLGIIRKGIKATIFVS